MKRSNKYHLVKTHVLNSLKEGVGISLYFMHTNEEGVWEHIDIPPDPAVVLKFFESNFKEIIIEDEIDLDKKTEWPIPGNKPKYGEIVTLKNSGAYDHEIKGYLSHTDENGDHYKTAEGQDITITPKTWHR